MPEARPLSATSHRRDEISAMFMAKDLRRFDGLSLAGEAKRFAPGFEGPDAANAGPAR